MIPYGNIIILGTFSFLLSILHPIQKQKTTTKGCPLVEKASKKCFWSTPYVQPPVYPLECLRPPSSIVHRFFVRGVCCLFSHHIHHFPWRRRAFPSGEQYCLFLENHQGCRRRRLRSWRCLKDSGIWRQIWAISMEDKIGLCNLKLGTGRDKTEPI